MKIGVIFPQTEIGAEAVSIRAYAQGVEKLGFSHVVAYDHVLGADPGVHHGWSGPYDIRSTFHEPMVLFGYLAAAISLELVTGVLILPQRQTALVAKQAAEVDILTGGHFRLGVGLGWNAVEYEALGQSFVGRGTRVAEQVALLRRLWDGADCHPNKRAREDDGGGTGTAAHPAADPHLVWGQFAAGASPGGPARGRLVPTGATWP